jgi:VIT1/CCC1 family predicted Fe2+/Mn2+ transporter
MQNAWIFVLALILGIIAIIGGIFYEANILLGSHPARAIAAFIIGAALLIIGIAGFVTGRRKG